MILLMLFPAAAAGAIWWAGKNRRFPVPFQHWRGAWLVIVILGAHVIANWLRSDLPVNTLVNRSEALLALGVLATFGWLNRDALAARWPAVALMGVLLGGAMNSLAIVVFGYMPVSRSATIVAGYPNVIGDHPDHRYVFVDAIGWPAWLLGDIAPIPGAEKVLSVGDLLLLPALGLAFALYVAWIQVSGHQKEANEWR